MLPPRKEKGKIRLRVPPGLYADNGQMLVNKFPLRPTLVIESGHGLQVYWLFTQLWVFADEEEWLQAQRLVQRFQETRQAQARAHG
jgi:hypothetical protein